MKKYIKSIILFFTFSLISYIILIWIWGNYAPTILKKNLVQKEQAVGFNNLRLEEVKKTSNIDVLFLGSSITYRGFDTRIFKKKNIKSFNLGSSAQTPVQTNFLLKKYINKLNAKLIIYEVNPENFTNEGVESCLDIISNEEIDFDLIKMSFNYNNIKVFNTLIYYTIHNLTYNLKNKIENHRNNDIYMTNGYVSQKKIVKANNKDLEMKTSNWPFLDKNKEAFEKSISLIKSKNVDLLLVQAPLPQKLKMNYNNFEIDSFFNEKGRYINFNNQYIYDDTLFMDFYHLNQDGVNFFNDELLNIIYEQVKK